MPFKRRAAVPGRAAGRAGPGSTASFVPPPLGQPRPGSAERPLRARGVRGGATGPVRSPCSEPGPVQSSPCVQSPAWPGPVRCPRSEPGRCLCSDPGLALRPEPGAVSGMCLHHSQRVDTTPALCVMGSAPGSAQLLHGTAPALMMGAKRAGGKCKTPWPSLCLNLSVILRAVSGVLTGF